MKNSIFLVLVALNVSACSVVAIRDYDPYYKNTQALAAGTATYSGVRVAAVSQAVATDLGRHDMACRLSVFNMPAGKSVAIYVRDAMTTELEAAKKISPASEPLEIIVAKLDSDTSGFSRGRWIVDFTYKTSQGSRRVETTTEFESALAADTACRNTAQALQDALRQNFLTYFTQSQNPS